MNPRIFPNQSELQINARCVYDTAKEFDQIDSNSYGYRYPIDKEGNYSTSPHQIVNLGCFYEHIEEVMSILDEFDAGLNIETDKRQIGFELLEGVKEYLGIEE